jgi:hypothetical protein
VRAILENPRYTGYAVFGRWTKHEVLLNPDDVQPGTSCDSSGRSRVVLFGPVPKHIRRS